MTSEGRIIDGCILLFVKSPRQVPVKSRLAESIGKQAARTLYENFIRDILKTLSAVSAKTGCAIRVYVYPPGASQEMGEWLGNDYPCLPQQGGDLGERMKNAFLAGFAEGYRWVMIVGSDVPDITEAILTEGISRLEEDPGAVIGPARDGGYYLVGFRPAAFLPAAFENIPWGTDTVFAETMNVFREARRQASLLPPWSDVDTLADLQDLRQRHRDDYFSSSRTMSWLCSPDVTQERSRKG